MPTVLRKDGYRFFFYSNDHKLIHIHVESGDKTSKFFLIPIELVKNNGFGPKNLKEITNLIHDNHELLITAWYEYFGYK